MMEGEAGYGQGEQAPLIAHTTFAAPQPIFHPSRALYRYTILFVIAMLCFGNYFTYDVIQPLDKTIKSPDGLDISGTQFGLLYSFYSFPNIILVFFGGILGDKFGLRISSICFSTLVVLGAVIVALGPTLSVGGLISKTAGFYIMLVGRTIFGIGAESLNVLQTAMVALWFSGTRDLAMALGITLSVSRLGDYLSLSLSAPIANLLGGFQWALWAGAVLCGLSYAAAWLYSFMDRYGEARVASRKPADPSENELNFGAVLRFDVRFWIVSFLCMTYYSGVIPFVSIASDFLSSKYGYSDTAAGNISGIVILSSMILSPFLGKFLDIVGRKPYFIVVGALALIPAHLTLAWTDFQPIVPIVVIGLSFSLVPGALWPSVPLVIKDKELATGKKFL